MTTTLEEDHGAIVAARPGRYFLLVAFLYGSKPCDWLGAVFRDPEGPWHMRYRFRYYDPEQGDPWTGKDEKNHYEFTCTDKDEDTVATKFLVAPTLLRVAGFNETLDVLRIRSDDPEVVVGAMSTRPWAHFLFSDASAPS